MQTLKITAGLGSLEAYPRLVKAGADECFAGYVLFSWLEKYSNITPLNRREVLMHALQLDTPGEMKLLASMVQDYGAPVALTFNSICYHPRQYPEIADMLAELSHLGFRDWILADPALILYLNQQRVEGRIHLSGEAGCFNPDSMRFFSRLNIARWIFPRKISPEDMARCIYAVPGAEYEAFALNEKCHYSGAFCSSLHCDELEHLCQVPCRVSGPECPPASSDAEADTGFGSGGCALCALPKLRRAGITHLKVVGRGGHIQNLERDVRLLRRALDLGDVPADTLRREITGKSCSRNCYYPEFGHKLP